MRWRDQRARDAWQSFKQLVDQFPDPPYRPTPALEERMHHRQLAGRYEATSARGAATSNRGAYLAAANRAQQVR